MHNRVHFPCSYSKHKASQENTTAVGFKSSGFPGDTFPWESESAFFFRSFEMIYESVVKPYFVYQNVRCGAGWQKKHTLNLHVCLSPSCISLSRCFLPASHRSGDWICRERECASHVRFTFDLCLTICHNTISANMTSLIYIWMALAVDVKNQKKPWWKETENNVSQASVNGSLIYHVL